MPSLKSPIERELVAQKRLFLKELGSRIRVVRLQNSLTKAEFAVALMLRVKTLSEIEAGKRQPGGRQLFALKEYFGVNESWLLTGRRAASENHGRKMEETMHLLGMFKRLPEESRDKILNIAKILMQKRHFNLQRRRTKAAGAQAAEKSLAG
ncbi:MAG TPA: helix-turn-helix transcriptional regulator [Thermodesulfobacteriota bacterium]